MSGQPAARIGDKLLCTTPQTTPAALPHAPMGMPIGAVGAPTVLIGGSPAARVGDFSLCPTPAPISNAVLRGAFPVPIMNMPAARMTDSGTPPHVGVIMPPCCPTVLIGLAGTTGNPRVGAEMCRNLANGRTSQSQGQSYNNCGIESSRQIINRTGGNMTEDGLMQIAKNNRNATGVVGGPNLFAEGGTTPRQQTAILNQAGVPATHIPPTATGAKLSQYELALSQGRGVISGGDVSGLPASAGYGTATGGHAVTVTGFDYDDNGNVTHVHYNDTNSQCGSRITAGQFQNFMDAESNRFIANGWTPFGSVATNNPIF